MTAMKSFTTILASFLLLLFFSISLAPLVSAGENQSKKSRKIRLLMRKLERSRDLKERMKVAKKLIEIGPEAIPHIEKRREEFTDVIYIYWYILQSIKKEKKIDPPQGKKKELTFVEERILWAEKAMKEGKYKYALNVLKALNLLITKKHKLRNKIIRLKIRAEEAYLRKQYIFAHFSTKKKIYKKGETIQIEVVVKNISPDPVKIRLTKNHILGRVMMEEVIFDPRGNRSRRNLYHLIRIHKTLTLAAQKEWKHTFLLNTKNYSQGSDSEVIYIYLKGYLRPRLIKTSAGFHSRYLPITSKAPLLIAPKKYVPLAKKADQNFRQALKNYSQAVENLESLQKVSEKLSRDIFHLRLDLKNLTTEQKSLKEKFNHLLQANSKKQREITQEIEKVEKTLQKVSPRLFFSASFLQGEEEKKKAILQICYTLDKTFGQYQKRLMILLSHLTEEPLHFNKKKWIIWCFKKYRFSDK